MRRAAREDSRKRSAAALKGIQYAVAASDVAAIAANEPGADKLHRSAEISSDGSQHLLIGVYHSLSPKQRSAPQACRLHRTQRRAVLDQCGDRDSESGRGTGLAQNAILAIDNHISDPRDTACHKGEASS